MNNLIGIGAPTSPANIGPGRGVDVNTKEISKNLRKLASLGEKRGIADIINRFRAKYPGVGEESIGVIIEYLRKMNKSEEYPGIFDYRAIKWKFDLEKPIKRSEIKYLLKSIFF